MFDFIRNLTRSAAEKRRAQLNAYLDGALSPAALRRLEAQLAEDETLRNELAQLRAVKQALAGLPRVRAPRNFTLNPAVYSRPVRPAALRLYPALRAATALAAVFFVLLVGVSLLQVGGGSVALAPSADSADSADSAAESAPLTAEVGVLALEESAPEEAEPEASFAEEVVAEEAAGDAVAADEARVEEEAADDAAGNAAEEPPAAAADEGEAAAPAATRGLQGGVSATAAPAATATLAAPRPAPEETEPPRIDDEALAETAVEATLTPAPPVVEAPLSGSGWLLGALLAAAGAGVALLLIATLVVRRRLP